MAGCAAACWPAGEPGLTSGLQRCFQPPQQQPADSGVSLARGHLSSGCVSLKAVAHRWWCSGAPMPLDPAQLSRGRLGACRRQASLHQGCRFHATTVLPVSACRPISILTACHQNRAVEATLGAWWDGFLLAPAPQVVLHEPPLPSPMGGGLGPAAGRLDAARSSSGPPCAQPEVTSGSPHPPQIAPLACRVACC